MTAKKFGPLKKLVEPVGLVTNPSKISTIGGMSQATNTLIRRAGVLEQRRGSVFYAAATDAVYHTNVSSRSLFPYANGLVGFFGDGSDVTKSKIGVATAPTWNFYNILLYENFTDTSSGRARMVVANSNLLAITGTGIYRLAGTSDSPALSGAPVAMCFDRTGPANVLVGSGGFLVDQFSVAYRGVIAIKDLNNNTHYGEPSARVVVSNATFTTGYSSTVSKNVALRLLFPPVASIYNPVGYFFQIYRSTQVPLGIQPNDDLQLVYEDYLSIDNLTHGYVDVVDSYSEAIPKGAYIHTAPNVNHAIGTIDGENGRAPLGNDACVFKDRLFVFNTYGQYTFTLTFVGTPSSGVSLHVTYPNAVGGGGGSFAIRPVTTGSAAQNIEQTAMNFVEDYNKTQISGSSNSFAQYVSGPDDIPGKIIIRSTSYSTGRFTVQFTATTSGATAERIKFSPVLSLFPSVSQTYTLQRVGTTVTATISTAEFCSYRVGEQATHAGATGFPAGTYTITAVTPTTFAYTEGSGAAGPSAAVAVTQANVASAVVNAQDDINTNGFAYSKIREMESFPLRNRATVGEKSIVIGRGVALRDSIVIWTYQGLYRLTGDSPDTFVVTLLDQTAKLLSSESVVRLSDSVIGWTTKGVIQVDDTGWRVISGDIKPSLDAVVSTSGIAAISRYCFAVGYDSDQVYELWYPIAYNSTSCAKAFVYSGLTGKWTDYQANTSYVCGVYNQFDDHVYYGMPYDSDHSFTMKERKDFASTDFQDDVVNNPATPTFTQAAIAKAIRFNPIVGKDVAGWKIWQEVMLMFESTTPSLLEVEFANDSGTANVIASASPSNANEPFLRLWPSYACNGSRFGVFIQASVIAESFQFLGYEIQWEEFGLGTVR